MKKFGYLIFLLCFIPLAYILQARNSISATNILRQIEAGKAVNYENFEIIGNLDLTSIQNRALLQDVASDSTQKILVNQINVALIFQNCIFKGSVSGYYHNYQQNTIFRMRFQKPLIFKNCEFQGESSFQNSEFREKVDFTGSEFKTEALFKNAEFRKVSSFQDVHFRGDANFRMVIFKKLASFIGAYFEEEADFKNNKFQQGGNFYKATFMSRAMFKSAEFYKLAFFQDAKFKGEVDFQNAQCDGKKWKP